MIDRIGFEKLVQYGPYVELTSYEFAPAIKSRLQLHTFRNGVCISCGKVRELRRRRSFSAARARKNFFMLVASNLSLEPTIMATYSMIDEFDLRSAYKKFRNFMNSLRSKGYKFEYIAVPEFQERGAVHFHALLWGFPGEWACVRSDVFYVDRRGYRKAKHICTPDRPCERNMRRFAPLWGHGFIEMVLSDGSPRLATYLAKYMTKASSDRRLSGLKAFTSSRGLGRPQTLSTYDHPQLFYVAKSEIGLDDENWYPEFEKDFPTQFLGKGNFRIFNKQGPGFPGSRSHDA